MISFKEQTEYENSFLQNIKPNAQEKLTDPEGRGRGDSRCYMRWNKEQRVSKIDDLRNTESTGRFAQTDGRKEHPTEILFNCRARFFFVATRRKKNYFPYASPLTDSLEFQRSGGPIIFGGALRHQEQTHRNHT